MEMSSLDLKFLLEEIKILIGGKIQKIYQKKKEIRIQVFKSGLGTKELYFDPKKVFITQYKRVGQTDSFGMFLRKKLHGQRIKDIRQFDFDRIIEIETEKNILILEMFSKGNIIFCDKEYMIVKPLEIQRWKDREVRPNVKYEYPPSSYDPFKLSKDEIKKLFGRSGVSLVVFLARNMGLSGKYAGEIVKRSENNVDKIKTTLEKIKFKPHLIIDDKKNKDFSVIDLEIYKDNEKKYGNISEILDEFFSEIQKKEVEGETEVRKEKEKFKYIIKKQEDSIKKWEIIGKKSREKAELLRTNYILVEKILEWIREKHKVQKWEDVKRELKKTKFSKHVKEIKEKEGKIILKLV